MSETCELSLIVTMNKSKSAVMFAEVDDIFVEVLQSFMSLPLGSLIKILEKQCAAGEAPVTIGSLTSLSRSSLFDNIDDEWRWPKLEGRNSKPLSSFVVCDDLRVVPVESGFIQTLNSIGITHTDGADSKKFTLGIQHVMDLLKFAVTSSTPLTDLVLKMMSSSVEEPKHEHEVVAEATEVVLQEIEKGVQKLSLEVVEPVAADQSISARPKRNKKLPGRFKEFKMG